MPPLEEVKEDCCTDQKIASSLPKQHPTYKDLEVEQCEILIKNTIDVVLEQYSGQF